MTPPVPVPPPRPPRPRRPSFGGFGALAVGGLAVLGAGVTALFMHHHSYDASTAVMSWAVALSVLAVALVVGGAAGRRAGIVGLFAVVAVVGTLLTAVTPKMHHMQAVGDRTWTPDSLSRATDGYGLGIGEARLDLRELDPAQLAGRTSPAHIPVAVGIGSLTIDVPSDVQVRVSSSAGAGQVHLVDGTTGQNLSSSSVVGSSDLGGDTQGFGVQRVDVVQSSATGPVQIVVDAKVGLGEVRVRSDGVSR